MTKFEKSCKEFKKRNGYLTVNQQKVLDQIEKERRKKTTKRIITPPRSEWDREDDSLFASAFDWGSQ